MSTAQHVADHRKKRKLDLMRVAGNQCCLCGYNKVSSALEFHHINPKNKSYGISTGNCYSLETDLNEIRKTVLVCANCHREIHEGLYSMEELYQKQIFDDNVAQELRDAKAQLETKTVYYCAQCGKEISRGAKLCESCAHELRRKAERPTRAELKNLIRTTPFTKIGELYGVTDNAIRKWCDAEGLPRKATEIKRYSDEEWEAI